MRLNLMVQHLNRVCCEKFPVGPIRQAQAALSGESREARIPAAAG